MAYEADIARWLVEAAEMEAKEEESLPDGRNPKEVAEQKIEQCLRYDATHPGALAAWVGIYVKTGRGPLVMKRLNRIVRDHPTASGPYRAIAAFMRITGKLDLAVQYFQNLHEQSPDEVKPIIHLSLAELYASQGNIAALREHRTKLAAYPPIDPLLQGMLFLEDNDDAGILHLSEQIKDDEAMKYTLWGMIAEAQGDLSNASQYYFHVSNQENPTWFAFNSLAILWLQNKNIEHARTYLAKAEELAANAPEVWLTRARIYQEMELYDKAKIIKHKLLSLDGCFSRTRKMAQRFLW
jgi:tetratricopeptide (TPR) repeat protein